MNHHIQKINQLAKEASPYLQQHANNPVDWYPWGKEALEKARLENKPILLSIGYAACHWCHVMAHESFEDQETADLMNELFVNIKIDREERPDLDKIYQTAHFVLTRSSGGWPLTVFLTPHDLIPFFSGTYFPRNANYQLPAFKDVLKTLASIYKNNPDDIKQQNKELLNILQQDILQQAKAPEPVRINNQPLEKGLLELQQRYDQINGGFGTAPKFPQPSKLEFLFQIKSPMTAETLDHMAQGGIYDQLEGGFFRYSVDASWEIPHFEKMLYDNGQLLNLYTLAAKQYDNPSFAQISREVAEWAINKMQAPEGGFYSSIDADSEGHEGKFYVWSKEDIQTLLSAQEYNVIQLYFGLNKGPNFEQQWHFNITQSLESVAKQLEIPFSEAKHLLRSAKEKLLNARRERIPPGLDKKVLTSWNSLMIKGMIIAGQQLKEPRFVSSAQQAIAFIKQHLWRNKRLLASYADKRAYLEAYLDDYAFLIDALLSSLQVSWNTDHLFFAIDLANTLLEHFYDQSRGGFFFTANDQEKVLYRPKTMVDEAIPAGNGVAIRVLLILGHLLGETRYIDAAEKTLQVAWPYLERFPSEHCAVLLGLREYLEPSRIIVLRGSENEMKQWQEIFHWNHDYVFPIPTDEKGLPGSLSLRKPREKICAYICQGNQCSAAIEDLDEFKKNFASPHEKNLF